MDIRALQVLEFPKLLSCLAGFAVSEAGGLACHALRPASDPEELGQRAAFFEQGSLWLEYSAFALENFPSLEGVLAFLENSSQALDLDALWTLRQTLRQGKKLLDSVESREKAGEYWPDFRAACHSRPLPQKSLNALLRCLNDDGLLRDEASPELALARGEIRRIHQQCSRRAGEFIREHNLAHYVQDEYITLSADRYVLPLKSNFKGKFPGIVHDYSQTGETCYFEPLFLLELNNKLQECKRKEREAERKIFFQLSALLREDRLLLAAVYALLVEIDVLQARHRLGRSYNGVLLRLGPDFPVNLRAARHPLLELAGASSAGSSLSQVQPVDICLESNQRTLIISGGNAGGKTVSLKTLGLHALMALCAVPVPAAPGGTLPFWEHLVAFIGDDQSLEDHLSTFTAQIRHLAAHWDKLGPASLVILDEFGAGTDPAQGAALAQAVLDEAGARRAWIFAATHFPALKAYAMSRSGVRSASVLFDPATHKPLFILAYDQAGASQALEVAGEHGLPESVLARARHYLLPEGEEAGRLMERLNRLALEKEQEAAALREERASCLMERGRLREDMRGEKEKLFTELRAQAAQVLREWKASRLSARQTLKTLAKARNTLRDSEKEERAADTAGLGLEGLSPGTELLYVPWRRKGRVLRVDARRKKVSLDLAGVSIWVEAGDLAVDKSGAAPAMLAGAASGVAGLSCQRLDLRGCKVDEALTAVDAFIDSSVLGGRESVEIIHGRGTGALRREIHAYIKRHPQVAAFALADEEQGGDGVTILTLK